MQRFLVGSKDTSHFKNIPVLGYSNKCLISAMTSRGGTVGGTGPRARCSPSCCIQSSAHRERRRGGWTRPRLFQLQSAPRLTDRELRAALCAARTNRRHWRGGQWQYRGVSDHEIWPDLRSCPRPQKRSLTPHCLYLSRSRRSPRCDRRNPQKARAISAVSSSAVALDCAVRGRALKALRVASPARARRLAALTARSANLWRATIDGLA